MQVGYTVEGGEVSMEWLENLSEAIQYIENHLDEEISYEEAARIACCSTYYFQRMFSYVAGIPLSEYIRRRRMTQAAFELNQGSCKVLDVALKYGYTSPTSFHRAFQSVHGITPAAAKKLGAPLHAYPAISFSIQITGGSAMPYHLREHKPFRIVGIRIPLQENMEENQRRIPMFWQEILQGSQFTDLCALADLAEKSIMGISVYEDPAHIYYYIGVESTQEVPEGMFELHLPSALWAVFVNEGRMKEDVQEVFRRFYTEWLPFSGYEYARIPDLEVYPIYKDKPLNGHSEVWIGIRKKKRSHV